VFPPSLFGPFCQALGSRTILAEALAHHTRLRDSSLRRVDQYCAAQRALAPITDSCDYIQNAAATDSSILPLGAATRVLMALR